MSAVMTSAEENVESRPDQLTNTMSAIETKLTSAMDAIHRNASEMRSNVELCMSRAVESLRSREVFLLSQIDSVQQRCVDLVVSQHLHCSRHLVEHCLRPETYDSKLFDVGIDESVLRSVSFSADLKELRRAIYKFGRVDCEYMDGTSSTDVQHLEALAANDSAINSNTLHSSSFSDRVKKELMHPQEDVYAESLKYYSDAKEFECETFEMVDSAKEKTDAVCMPHFTIFEDLPVVEVTEQLTVYPEIGVYITVDPTTGNCFTDYRSHEVCQVLHTEENSEASASSVDLNLAHASSDMAEHFGQSAFIEFVKKVLSQPSEHWIDASNVYENFHEQMQESALSFVIQTACSHELDYWIHGVDDDLPDSFATISHHFPLANIHELVGSQPDFGSQAVAESHFVPAALILPIECWLPYDLQSVEVDLSLSRSESVVSFTIIDDETDDCDCDLIGVNMVNCGSDAIPVDQFECEPFELFTKYVRSVLGQPLDQWLDEENNLTYKPVSVSFQAFFSALTKPLDHWISSSSDSEIPFDSLPLGSLSFHFSPEKLPVESEGNNSLSPTSVFSSPFSYVLSSPENTSVSAGVQFSTTDNEVQATFSDPIVSNDTPFYLPLLSAFSRPLQYWLAPCDVAHSAHFSFVTAADLDQRNEEDEIEDCKIVAKLRFLDECVVTVPWSITTEEFSPQEKLQECTVEPTYSALARSADDWLSPSSVYCY